MFAKVQPLRAMGVLSPRKAWPPPEKWATGILEFSQAESTARRLILRAAMSPPDRGIILELFEPRFVDVEHPYLRFRGVEPVRLAGDELGAMVQDWLVLISG